MPLSFDEDAVDGVPPGDTERLLEKIEWLWANRAAVTHHPLKSNLGGFFKRRIGKYRIIYSYDANPDDMVIRLVGTRDEIYKQAADK